MYYRINVAKLDPKSELYKHHFDVQAEYLSKAQELYAEFVEYYPEPLYNITVSFWQSSGTDITDEFERR